MHELANYHKISLPLHNFRFVFYIVVKLESGVMQFLWVSKLYSY